VKIPENNMRLIVKFVLVLVSGLVLSLATLSFGQVWNASFNSWDSNGNIFILTKNCEDVKWEGEPNKSKPLNAIPDSVTVQIWVDNDPVGPGPEDTRPTDLTFNDFITSSGNSGMLGLVSSPYNFQLRGMMSVAKVKYYLKCNYVDPVTKTSTTWVSNTATALNDTGDLQDLPFMKWTCSHK
jgi:hypothetical protein